MTNSNAKGGALEKMKLLLGALRGEVKAVVVGEHFHSELTQDIRELHRQADDGLRQHAPCFVYGVRVFSVNELVENGINLGLRND